MSAASATISIERADPQDQSVRALIEELDAYQLQLYPSESNHLLDLETMTQGQMHLFSICVDGVVQGCGGFWAHDGYAEVKRLYVHPDARGRGLARKLMNHIENQMRFEGFKLAKLETGVLQPEALGLYRALGYSLCGPFGAYPVDDPLSVFMQKRL